MKKRISLLLCITLAFALVTGCAPKEGAGTDKPQPSTAQSQKPEEGKIYRFALISNGPINDGDWNENAWRGLQAVKEELGDQVEVSYSENVTQADYEDTFYGYAKDGYDLVIGNGFEFSEACFKVCDDFPETKFAIVNGLEYRDNVCSFEYDNVEFGYLCGYAMGLVAEQKNTNAAFICAEAIPSYRNFYIGMEAGVKAASGKATSKDYYTGDWTDLTKAADVAKNAIANNEKVLVPWIGPVNHAVFTVADENDCMFVNTAISLGEESLKDNVLITITQDNSKLLAQGCKSVIDGTYPANGAFTGSFANNLNMMGDFGDSLTQEQKDKITDVYNKLVKGEIELPAKVSE